VDGGDVESTEKSTFTEIFEKNCSYYMSIGMSYDEFWYGSNDRPKYYREAHKLRNKAKNQEMWIAGMYTVDAITASLDKKAKYPKEPYDLFKKTAEEKKADVEKERKKIIDYFTELKKRWDNGTNRQLNS